MTAEQPLTVVVAVVGAASRVQAVAHARTSRHVRVVGVASDPASAREQVREQRPDAIVMDPDIGLLGGTPNIGLIREACPSTAIVVRSSDEELAWRVLVGGADAWVGTAADWETIVDTLRLLVRRPTTSGSRAARATSWLGSRRRRGSAPSGDVRGRG